MRSHGGPHTLDNLAHLCELCHNHVHAHPADSYDAGWLMRSDHQPKENP